ncbi:hypothetical protein BTR23_19995 [Alkalihalophilus pseudofirmus]|uniref:Ig-like domain-containing protein n=1 Tax=Alkalihalobacterium alkalinitrilicum TaxID=427920 RepID=UPI00094CF395|nr:Ig-like domain-containing protein [Alkalihalobacterium alkalinitrilicum]OLO27591.1 hypothetical protein BTR23_19995 [Alkalihalophilus pseudofirmus]
MKIWSLTLLILTLYVLSITTEAKAQTTPLFKVEYEEADPKKPFNEGNVFKPLGVYQDVPNNKTWSFTFNDNINSATIAPNSLYVLDATGTKVDSLIINDNEQTITVLPPPNRYLEGETYSIYFTSKLKSSTGVPLLNNYQLKFSVGYSENLISDPEDEFKYNIPIETSIIKTYKSQSNESIKEFDIVNINGKQEHFESPMVSSFDQTFIYTPNSFYAKIKEMMIRKYTPPVYY